MVPPTDLVHRWQTKYEDNFRLLVHGSAQWRWLRLAYGRLYGFLLRNYAGPTTEIKDHASCRDFGTRGTEDLEIRPDVWFSDDVSEIKVAPPKSDGTIRSALKSLHRANDHSSKQDPLALGLHNNDWVVAAEYRHVRQGHDGLALLRRNRIECRVRSHGRRTFIEVCLGNAEQAVLLLQSKRRMPPSRWQLQVYRSDAQARRHGRALGWGLVTALLAAVPTFITGLIFVDSAWGLGAAIASFFAGGSIGFLIGHFEALGG